MSMGPKRLFGRLALTAMFVMPVAAPNKSYAEILPTYTNTGPSIAVSCNPALNGEGNLEFGVIRVLPGQSSGEVTVTGTSSGIATVTSGTGISVSGSSRPALCTVTDINSTASVVLSGGGGSFSGDTLTGATLKVGADTIPVSLNVSATSLVANNTVNNLGTGVYIGGIITVPSSVVLGTYSETFTITVTE